MTWRPPSASPARRTLSRGVLGFLDRVRLRGKNGIVVGDHGRVTSRTSIEKPEDHRLRKSVQYIGNESGEVKLLPDEQNSNERRDDDQTAEDLADLAKSDGRHGWVGDVADHQERENQHQATKAYGPVQVAEDGLVVQSCLAEPVVRGECHPGGRARETVEVFFGAPRLLDVEACKPDHGARRKKEREDPVPAVPVQHGEVHDHRRRESEGDRIDERVQLRAESRSRSGCSRYPAVECVAYSAEHDIQTSCIELSARRGDDREDAEEKTGERESIREDDDRAISRTVEVAAELPSAPIGCKHQSGISASTVTPAVVRSPSFARTFEVVGMNTSTREPNRIIPIRSPCFAESPILL